MWNVIFHKQLTALLYFKKRWLRAICHCAINNENMRCSLVLHWVFIHTGQAAKYARRPRRESDLRHLESSVWIKHTVMSQMSFSLKYLTPRNILHCLQRSSEIFEQITVSHFIYIAGPISLEILFASLPFSDINWHAIIWKDLEILNNWSFSCVAIKN